MRPLGAWHGARMRPLLLTILALPSLTGAEPPDFDAEVAPILETSCLSCHDARHAKGDLRLDTSAQAHQALTPDRQGKIALIEQISGPEPEMPKQARPLSAAKVAVLSRWVAAGAPWPAERVLTDKPVRDLDWWSLAPLRAVPPPRPGHPIDAFVQAKLDERGLIPAGEAAPPVLARRVTFDLTGLPPTPGQLAAAARDGYEPFIDSLLASPAFGEKWASHWLDIARYAESHGYDKDKLRANAWPYRDYVIRAFNDDKPYDRFAEEQVAGDALHPGTRDGIVGLGFLAAGPWDLIAHCEVGESKVDGRIAKHLDRDEMLSAVYNVFTATTVQCAQCHNHKFDPIRSEDYYRLHAVFAAVDRADRPYGPRGEPVAGGEPAIGSVFAAATSFPPSGAFISTGGKPRSIHLLVRGDVRNPGPEMHPGMPPLWPGALAEFPLPPAAPESAARAMLAKSITSREDPLFWRTIANRLWLWCIGRPLVGTPNDFGRMGMTPTDPELLDWLAVRLRDDPAHSLKSLIRLIVTSATYRRASDGRAENAERDAGNLYAWRGNRRRLSAEEFRDAVLATSGQLRLEPRGGPSFADFVVIKPEHSPHYEYGLHDPDDRSSFRRSIYRQIVRSQPQPLLTILDCADPALSVPQREESTTALQALAQWNDRFTEVMARHFAERIEAMDGDRIGAAFALAVGRRPDAEERAILAEHLRRFGPASTARIIFNMNGFNYVD